MDAGALIPLAVFVMLVLIVGITSMTRLHNIEIEVQQGLHLEELEHRRKMQELETQLERVKTGTGGN